MAKLVLIGRGRPQEIVLGHELTIGRGYSNLLRLEGDEISRVHSIIYRHDEAYVVRDLDSKNGVYVNGQRVMTSELRPGDKIQVGKFTLLFDPPVDAEATSATPVQPAIHDDAFARSQLFSAGGTSNPAASNGAVRLHDEVTLLTREELSDLIRHPAANLPSGATELEQRVIQILVTKAVESNRDHETGTLTDLMLTAVATAIAADGGVIVLSGPEDAAFTPVAIYPQQADVAVNRVVMREGFSLRRAVLCPVTGDCGLFRDSTTVTRDRIYTLLSIPLIGPDGEAGLLYFDRKGDDADPFSLKELVVSARIARLLERQLFEPRSRPTPAPEAISG